MQVYTFIRKSTLPIMCLSCQGVDYRLRLSDIPFPVRSCPDMSCPELFYWQALLRRLHRNVHMSVPASVGIPVSVCSMPTILSESIHLLGVHTNSHWATLYTTRHRAIHRHTEIKVSRKYASRSKGRSATVQNRLTHAALPNVNSAEQLCPAGVCHAKESPTVSVLVSSAV